jgi:hypothetical protein
MIRKFGTALSALLVFGATFMAGGVPADAAITPTSTATQIANAISATGGTVTGTFVSKPPSGTPDAVGDLVPPSSALAAFPTDGSSYGILTTGDATQAANAPQSNFASANDAGGNVRGNSDYDVSILKVDLPATPNTCLHVDFRFLSEEFPEFVGSSYNDAFIAELDTSNWTTSGSTINAPNNFAFDPDHQPITINSTGATHMTAAEAAGTVYDGATPLLVAQTPIAANVPHSVYFSIFDDGDQVYDSAVFLDNLFLGTENAGQCQPGAKPNLALSLTATPNQTPTGITAVALNKIPPTGIQQHTPPTQDAPIGKSPIGKSPIGKSPIGKSPIGKSPIGKSPIGKSPVSAFPLLRPGGWQKVLADSCDFQTAVPQGVTLSQLLTDSCVNDNNPATFPEFSPGSTDPLTLDQINWALSPAANASMLSLLLGDVTWNDVTPPAGGWCSEWSQLGVTCPGASGSGLELSDPIIVTESNGLNIDRTSLPVKTVSDITSPSTKTFFWGITVIDLNIPGSFLGSVQIGQIPSANRGLFVDCTNTAVHCQDGSTQTLGDVFNLDPDTLSKLKPDGTLGDLGMGILGPRTLSDITIAFLDPNAINWEDVPLSGMGLERLPAGNPTNLLQYSLTYEVPCADSAGMQATVKLPSGFVYRPGSSTVSGSSTQIGDPTSDGQGGLVWHLSSCSGPGGTQIQINFKVMPGFSLGTFTSDASVKTNTTSALLEEAAAVTVNDGFAGNGTPANAAAVSGNAMFVGHLANPGQQAFFSFQASPGDQVSVSLSHLSRDYDLVLYAPTGAQEADRLRSTPPFLVPLGKASLPDPLAGSGNAETLVPEALQDVPLVSNRVVAGISDFRGTEQEYITTTGVSGNAGSTYLVQVSANNSANGREPFVLTIRTSTPGALPACSARTFPNTPSLSPLAAPVIGAADNTLVIVDQRRLEAAFGTTDASLIMSKLQDLVTNHVADTGVQGKVLDLSSVATVNTAFAAADQNPCSPATNNNVVRAINAVVDGLKNAGNNQLAGLRNMVLVGEDDIIPHARILDGTTDGNERDFAGDTYFTNATNQLGGAFGNGYFLSDTPYASLKPLSILGQTVYPMQVALGRLGGSASTIENTIDLFVASKGMADPRTAASTPRKALETDYGFFRDGGGLIHQSQASQVGAANAQQLTDATVPWDKTDLTDKLFNVHEADISSADSCLNGCFFGHDVVDGAVGPHFSGGFSPTIIGGLADLNGDGLVNGADDSNAFYGDTSIIDGALDCNAWHNKANSGAAGDGTIDGSDDCNLIGYDGTTGGVTIQVVDGSFATANGALPTVFNATDPGDSSVADADFAWSAINGRVDANGNGTIDGNDCHFGLIGQTPDVGLGDPTDGVDILGSDAGCGFAAAVDPALNGLVDMNSGANPPDLISPNAHYDQYRLLPAKQNANGSWQASDLFTTQEIEGLAGTPFKLRLLYGIGCHFGLDFPDRLAGPAPTGTDAQRVLDWEQAYFDKGAAVLVGNLGFGFGDTATVAFSERLMANFAANLDGSMSVGQALVKAEKDYLTSLASFSPYDQKVLEQTIMWGFPMYKLPGGGGGSGPAGPSAVSSSAAAPVPAPSPYPGVPTVDTTTVSLTPTFNPHTAPDGSQFYDADGLTQSTHPYPVMPKTVTDLPSDSGKSAKGAILLSGTIAEEPINITFANATIDNSANEPATPFETIYPTTHQSIGTFVDQTGSPTQTLVVLPGMFRPDTDLTNSPSRGTFRKLTASQWQVTYGAPNDVTGPQFVSIDGSPSASSTLFSVNVAGAETDDTVVVVRVAALYVGDNTYHTVDLAHGAGTLWTGTLASGQVREFTVFALDSDGNVATANNRGIAYAPVADTAHFITSSVGSPKFISGNGDTYVTTSTPITVTVGDLGSGTCTIEVFGPLNSTPSCGTGDNTFHLPDANGAYTINVSATDGAGNKFQLSFDLANDTIKPDIVITRPVDGATYGLNEVVKALSSCADTGSGIATPATQCIKTTADNQNINTATIGAKTFTVTATDNVGNTRTTTVTYYVGYKVCLLYDPSKPFRINTSTIPIKLQICDAAGKNLSSASITLTADSLKNVTSGAITSPPPPNAGDGLVFRFDKKVATGGGYIYNLSTKGLAANANFELRFKISGEATGTALHVAPFSTKP